MSEPVMYNETSVSIDSLNIEGMSLEDIRNLPPTKALLMHPDGRVEVIDKEVAVRQREQAESYKPVHPRSVSLFSCLHNESAAAIGFYKRLRYPVDFEKLKSAGQWDGSENWCAPLYHGNVIWSYGLRIAREEDGSGYSFTIFNVGARLASEDPMVALPGLTNPPPLINVKLILVHKDNKTVDDLKLKGCDDDLSLTFSDRYSEQQLRELAADGDLSVSLLFMAPRHYFSLPSVIDLQAKPTVPVGAQAVVDAILRGEKPEDSDWEITGSHYESDEDLYSVHKTTFDKFSSGIEAVPGASEVGLLKGLDDYGVRMAIRIAYGVEVPLPEREEADTKALIGSLLALFGDHFTTVVIPQWERAICSKALAIEKGEPLVPSMVQLLHLLNIIWSLPAGSMPFARRIAVGVLADMGHLNARSSLQMWVHESVMPHLEDVGFHSSHTTSVLDAFYNVMNIVPGTEKFALKAGGGLVDPSVAQESGEQDEDGEKSEEED